MQKVRLTIEYTDEPQKIPGDANGLYVGNPREKKIYISEEDGGDTLIHEIAHFLCDIFDGTISHGKKWKKVYNYLKRMFL